MVFLKQRKLVILSAGRVTNMLSYLLSQHYYVQFWLFSSASKSPRLMSAKSPQKVVSKKGSFYVSNKFGCKGTQNFGYMQEGERFFPKKGSRE